MRTRKRRRAHSLPLSSFLGNHLATSEKYLSDVSDVSGLDAPHEPQHHEPHVDACGLDARHEARVRPVRIQSAWRLTTSPSARREARVDVSDACGLDAGHEAQALTTSRASTCPR